MAHPAPHSAVHRFIQTYLPSAVHRFLFGHSEEFPVANLVFRALFGAAGGTVLFLGIVHNLPLTFDLKVAVGCVFVAVCVAGGLLSSAFRCSILLMFPSMLGSRGRSYLMLLTLSVLYTGPVSNIQRNVEAAAMSVSCNLDLQVRHSRLVWKEAVRPFLSITQELMDGKADLEFEALNVSKRFQDIRDEILLQYGYDRFETKRSSRSTQEEFTAKTLKQCDNVVAQGMQRCVDWFNNRWLSCMETIPVPIINSILCVCMKFEFLCDIMKVMTPWCKENIPVEKNFGQFFDQLNVSVDLLSREFTANLAVEEEEQQSVLGGAQLDQQFTETVKASFQKLTSTMGRVLNILQLLLSFTFITIFTQAFGYLRQYRRDIYFDNVYVTPYFRRIDARRQKAGKRCLLPLKKPEKNKLINPRSLKIHPKEVKEVMSGVFQVVTVSLLSFVLLTVDFSLFHVLDIISRHTLTEFNVTSSHEIDISVGGQGMMARLLRTTISAFNSSYSLNIQSDNQECISPPSTLSAKVYVSCVGCILLMALFSCLQVYANRLRRVIAAFYNPKREKARILFLYNLQIHERISSTGSKLIMDRGQRIRTVFQRVIRWGRRLWLHHHGREASSSAKTHYANS